ISPRNLRWPAGATSSARTAPVKPAPAIVAIRAREIAPRNGRSSIGMPQPLVSCGMQGSGLCWSHHSISIQVTHQSAKHQPEHRAGGEGHGGETMHQLLRHRRRFSRSLWRTNDMRQDNENDANGYPYLL